MQHVALGLLVCLAHLKPVVSADEGEAPPQVCLSHGGILTGIRSSFQGVSVDVFLGIRYVSSPTGARRFKKPEEYPSWQGEMKVTSIGSRCPQIENGSVVGEEDCLFMDVTVPGGVRPGANKTVMVWIHSGGYKFGMGSPFIGTPLAVLGDVIYVTFNYRIGMLGFLADGPGTGNFGLWDQRAALIWVKKNIAQFGGDPDSVTIFGESSGAGSVSAQMMSPHNDGLFKRGIQQSGTLYQMLPASQRLLYGLVKSIREQTNCNSTGLVYDCLMAMTSTELFTTLQIDYSHNGFWHPISDNDFFGADVDEYSYESTKRFDSMVGMNGQDGGIMLALDAGMYAMVRNETIENGMGIDLVRGYLTFTCPRWFTPFSAELCADFVINNYELDKAADDKERAIRLMEFLGEVLFDADSHNQLVQHSSSNKATYAYFFTEPSTLVNNLWQIPKWAKTSADHADELMYIFGGVYLDGQQDPLWNEILSVDKFARSLLMGASTESDKPFTALMMTMWTNFAKTGNPNQPVPLAGGIPAWPTFDKHRNQFMELRSNGSTVIPTPDKERLEKLQSHIYSARKLQFAADRPSAQEEVSWVEKTRIDTKSDEHDEL